MYCMMNKCIKTIDSLLEIFSRLEPQLKVYVVINEFLVIVPVYFTIIYPLR